MNAPTGGKARNGRRPGATAFSESVMSTKRPAPPTELFPLIYGELRRVARRYLGRERKNHTLQPTALVHEAWMKLQKEHGEEWQGRTHGLALGAQAMRRLLVDHGRHQKRQKRGGGVQNLELDDLLKAGSTSAVPVEDLLTLEDALTRLEAIDPRAAQVVVLRFFSGMSSPEVAEHLGVSIRTVESDWTHARAWLKRELSGHQDKDAGVEP
jgi:RNA polymerase sigma-70 factor (ECF subfamily)